jgi:hypothetical protein
VNAYVAAGYGVTLVVLGGYALHVLRRARSLRRRAGAGGGRG